jgi:hypothetical protein
VEDRAFCLGWGENCCSDFGSGVRGMRWQMGGGGGVSGMGGVHWRPRDFVA